MKAWPPWFWDSRVSKGLRCPGSSSTYRALSSSCKRERPVMAHASLARRPPSPGPDPARPAHVVVADEVAAQPAEVLHAVIHHVQQRRLPQVFAIEPWGSGQAVDQVLCPLVPRCSPPAQKPAGPLCWRVHSVHFAAPISPSPGEQLLETCLRGHTWVPGTLSKQPPAPPLSWCPAGVDQASDAPLPRSGGWGHCLWGPDTVWLCRLACPSALPDKGGRRPGGRLRPEACVLPSRVLQKLGWAWAWLHPLLCSLP